MEEIKTKVCKCCGVEKPVREFNHHYYKNGNIFYDTKCKVCTWFKNNTKYIIKDGWNLEEYRLIIHYLLNKKFTINKISELLNKDLLDLCDVVVNFLQVRGTTPLKVEYKCDCCNKDSVSNPSRYLSTGTHCCSKECSNKFKKDKNYHKIIGEGNCLYCNNKFKIYDNVPDQKFCSSSCKSKYYYEFEQKQETVVCSNCKKLYSRRKPSRSRQYENNYCSLECELEFKHKEKWEFRKCEICGEEFECLKSSSQRFCGYECQGVWQSKTLIGENANHFDKKLPLENRMTTCDWCGKEVTLIPSKLLQEHHFCSHECSRSWLSKHYVNTDENIDRQRKLAVKILEDGLISKTETEPQLIINDLLKNMDVIYKNEKGFTYYNMDNYLIDYNLAIEVMGTFYHQDPRFYDKINYEERYKTVVRDKAKHTYLKNKYDIEILYLWEEDIKNNLDLCKELILKYIQNSGILNNYQSFNYTLKNNKLVLNNQIVRPYIEYNASELKSILDIKVKEKISKKQPKKWIQFNCENCGTETEQLKSKYNKNKHHFCSHQCTVEFYGKLRTNKIS